MKIKKAIGIVFLALAILVAIVIGLAYYSETLLPSVPEIVSIEFPANIPLNTEVEAKIEFRDKEGDIVELVTKDLNRTETDVLDLRPLGSLGITNGYLPFILTAEDSQEMMEELILVDRAGHESAPYLIRYTAGDPTDLERRYDEEQTEILPVTVTKKLHVFIVASSDTDLEDMSPERSKNVLERWVIPEINGLWDQCALAFEVATTTPVRLENLKVKNSRTYSKLFTTKNGEEMILIRSYEEGIAWFDAAADALGVPKGDVAVFIFGYDIWNAKDDDDIDGFAGERSVIFTWRHLRVVNDETGEILIPKLRMSVLAHELGHVYGLGHQDEEPSIPLSKWKPSNLMQEINILVSELLPEQCRIVRSRL
jgi:hypothetical protein